MVMSVWKYKPPGVRGVRDELYMKLPRKTLTTKYTENGRNDDMCEEQSFVSLQDLPLSPTQVLHLGQKRSLVTSLGFQSRLCGRAVQEWCCLLVSVINMLGGLVEDFFRGFALLRPNASTISLINNDCARLMQLE